MGIQPDELWIGDFVHSRSHNEVGRFEGERSPGMAIVRFGDFQRILPADDLDLAEDPQINPPKEPVNPEGNPLDINDTVRFDRTIDLHIDVLNPSLKNETPSNILRYQLSRCREFIGQAIRHRVGQVRIIHGIGEGVLRREIEVLLDKHPGVNHYLQDSSGGAQDVWLYVSAGH